MKKLFLRYIFEIVILFFCIAFSSAVEGNQKIMWFLFVALMFVLYIGYSVYMYIRYDRDKTREDNIPLFRDIPSDISPAGASYLVREKVDLHVVYSTLLHLTNKNVLSIEKNGKDYIFTLINHKKGLSKVEEYILEWIFKGEGSHISMKDFKRECKDERGKSYLIEELKSMEPIIKEEVEHFFEDLKPVKRKLGITCLMAILTILLISCPIFGGIAFVPPVFLGFMTFYHINNLMKKNEEGKEEYLKWCGFSLFLKEQMDASRRETEEVILWDHYMTYAVALGRASKSLKELDWLAGDIVEVRNGASFMTNT